MPAPSLTLRPRPQPAEARRALAPAGPPGGLSVLHLTNLDHRSGAGKSAYRIHDALRRAGVRSRLLARRVTHRDPDVGRLAPPWLQALDRAVGGRLDRLGLQGLGYPSSFLLPRHPWVRQADVVQLHSIHGGGFSHTALPLLARGRPVVWLLHDMWPLTGHCGYSFACERWRTGCGRCPDLRIHPALPRDTTALLWRVKRQVYARTPLVLAAPSRWLAGLARQSPLLARFPVHVIPPGVDTSTFRPVPTRVAREALGLPPDGSLLLFSAEKVEEPRKGGALLHQALARLQPAGGTPLRLLVVGSGAAAWAARAPLPAHTFDYIAHDHLMALCYAAADLFVLPTLAETLGNALLESLACGTPAVAFATGGVPEVVRHLETGYLAQPGDVEDLAAGLHTLLADAALREALGRRGRALVEAEHTLAAEAQRYLALYGLVTRRSPRLALGGGV